MQRIFLFLLLSLNLLCFAQQAKPNWTDFESVEKQYNTIEQMYEDLNLSECPLFTGEFINFGFWKDIPCKDIISQNQRLESEKNLYRYVLSQLQMSTADKVLEVGCGLGRGTALVLEDFKPASIHAIDRCKVQVERALETNQGTINKYPNQLFFVQGIAEHIPFLSNSFDKVFSIEALQHFDNIQAFAKEAYRVLKPNGRIAVATYFGKSKQASRELNKLIPIIEGGTDHAYFITDFKQNLEEAGFKEVTIESLGQQVWPSFNQWICQVGWGETWNQNWYKAYQAGLVDYYLVKAKK
jgi:cyclopropane fatty-acyl-phospholipid synthase-like methyltransferase